MNVNRVRVVIGRQRQGRLGVESTNIAMQSMENNDRDVRGERHRRSIRRIVRKAVQDDLPGIQPGSGLRSRRKPKGQQSDCRYCELSS